MMGAPTRHRGRSRYPTRSRNAGATGAAPVTFNPLTDWTTDPIHGVWASDPSWSNPGDGGAVASWRNGGTVGGDPAQGTGSAQPTYRASTAAFGNRPTVQFDGGDHLDVNVADVAQAYYIVAVGSTGGAGTLEVIVGTGTGVQTGIGDTIANAWVINMGTAVPGGTRDSNAHLWRATANGASSALFIDESSVASGNAGAGSFARFILGAASSDGVSFFNKLTGHIALALVFNTNPAAQAEWATFTAWVEEFYGIPLP